MRTTETFLEPQTLSLKPCINQGARIGEGCLIDSMDVTDFPLVHLGDGVAVNVGATIMGHSFKDGYVHFAEVSKPPFLQGIGFSVGAPLTCCSPSTSLSKNLAV